MYVLYAHVSISTDGYICIQSLCISAVRCIYALYVLSPYMRYMYCHLICVICIVTLYALYVLSPDTYIHMLYFILICVQSLCIRAVYYIHTLAECGLLYTHARWVRTTIYTRSLSADYYIHTLASRSRVFSLRIYILYIFLSSLSRSLFLPLSCSHTHTCTHTGLHVRMHAMCLIGMSQQRKKKKRYLHATGFGFHRNHWSKRLIDRHRRRRKRRRRHGCRRNSGR